MMNDKKFYLTPNEFSVISAGFGLSMVYGLKQIDGRLDTKEICMALHNMYVNNLIENQDAQQFIADPEITTMMRCIKSAHFFVRVSGMIGSKECVFCIYPAKLSVVIEDNQANANKVILYMGNVKDVITDIIKETSNKQLHICCMSTSNGRIISEEVLDENTDKNTRIAALTNNYMSIAPTEVEQNDIN